MVAPASGRYRRQGRAVGVGLKRLGDQAWEGDVVAAAAATAAAAPRGGYRTELAARRCPKLYTQRYGISWLWLVSTCEQYTKCYTSERYPTRTALTNSVNT